MKYLKLICLTVFLISISCKEKNENSTELDARPEIIEILNSKFNGAPIILSKNEIIKSFGKPTFEKPNCVIFSTLVQNSKEFKYDCFIYDSDSRFGFDIYDNIGYVSYVSFGSENIKIKTPQIELTNKTTIQEFKKKFPKSYDLRIMDNENRIMILSLNDELLDERKESANIIELGFEKGTLKYYKYQIAPEYILELNK